MPLSNYARGKIHDHIYGRTSWTMPATIYVALYTTDPTNADTGTEVTGGSYARKLLSMGPATAGVGENSALVNFGTATANWGTVTHIGIRDASSGGNLLAYGPLTTSKVVNNGDSLDFPIGDIDSALT